MFFRPVASSDPVYVDAELAPANFVGVDVKHLLQLDANDPEVLVTYRFDTLRCSSSDSLG